jgi:hypothetical protein
MTNAARCRAYYQRVKQNPEKYRARIAQISERRRRVTASPPEDDAIKALADLLHAPVPEPQGGKHAASQTQGDVTLTAEQILDAWREHFAQ